MIIRGNTVGTTMPKPDWKQNDPEKGGFIFNKDKAPQAYYIHATYKDDDFVLDKTMAEIVEAVENGFTPFICYVDGDSERYLPLKFITEDKTSAVFASFENGKEYQIFVESDAEETWVIGQGVIEKEYALKSDIPEIPEYPEYPGAPEGGGGGAKAFYLTILQDENGAWTPSKTYEEVKAAYEAGSAIIAGVDVGSWWAYVPLGEMGASGTHAFVGYFIDQEGYSNGVVLMASHCAINKGSNPIGGGAGGSGGVGIDPDSIESHSTNEDGGENTLEFNLTDGTHVKLSAWNGKTPEKGVDYFTEKDKAAFVQDVLAALPTWEGGSY